MAEFPAGSVVVDTTTGELHKLTTPDLPEGDIPDQNGNYPTPSVLYGAAYRVAFERIMPEHCGPQGRSLEQATEIANAIRIWVRSSNLAAPVAFAYEKAVSDVMEKARTVHGNTVRALRMVMAYDNLPKPPKC